MPSDTNTGRTLLAGSIVDRSAQERWLSERGGSVQATSVRGTGSEHAV